MGGGESLKRGRGKKAMNAPGCPTIGYRAIIQTKSRHAEGLSIVGQAMGGVGTTGRVDEVRVKALHDFTRAMKKRCSCIRTLNVNE